MKKLQKTHLSLLLIAAFSLPCNILSADESTTSLNKRGLQSELREDYLLAFIQKQTHLMAKQSAIQMCTLVGTCALVSVCVMMMHDLKFLRYDLTKR